MKITQENLFAFQKKQEAKQEEQPLSSSSAAEDKKPLPVEDTIDHNRFDWMTKYIISQPRNVLKYINQSKSDYRLTQFERTASGEVRRKSIQYYKDLYKNSEGRKPNFFLANQESVFAIKALNRNEFTSKKGKRMVRYDITLCDSTGELSFSIFPDNLDKLFPKPVGKMPVEIEAENDKMLKNWKEWPFLHICFDVSGNEYASENFEFSIKSGEFVDFDQVNINELLETPYRQNALKMFDQLYKEAEQLQDPVYRTITTFLLEQNKEGFLYMPAAKTVHEENVGGLLEHTLRVLQFCKGFAAYPNDPINTDLLYAGAILHDIGKLVEFDPSQNGLVGAYSAAGNLMGHLHIGASVVEKAYAQCIKIQEIDGTGGIKQTKESDEKIACLCHMILSHHKEPEYGAVVRPMILEAVLLHEADTVDTAIKGYAKAYADAEAGQMATKKSYFLGNVFVYRPSSVTDDKVQQ